jgi:hypothetical protein
MPSFATARACRRNVMTVSLGSGSPHMVCQPSVDSLPRLGRAQPLPAALSDRPMELNDLIEAFFVIAFLASAILLALGLWRRRK